jgi:hypothetical protein
VVLFAPHAERMATMPGRSVRSDTLECSTLIERLSPFYELHGGSAKWLTRRSTQTLGVALTIVVSERTNEPENSVWRGRCTFSMGVT